MRSDFVTPENWPLPTQRYTLADDGVTILRPNGEPLTTWDSAELAAEWVEWLNATPTERRKLEKDLRAKRRGVTS
jgi:hypothetical protein